ncbi:MAG: 50S ribosomal protein L22 [Fimbriimonadaceae bacterium]|nr:50S ribosomal protein L22 [Fimbriimonadaceae bacterium]
MEVQAVLRNVRVQPRKVRIVAAKVKGKPVAYATNALYYHPSKGAHLLRKTLISAIANAQENHGLAAEDLRIVRISVDEGPVFKRIRARAMGRAYRILKKTAHITVVLDDEVEVEQKAAGGTKAKPRPTFAAPKKKSGGKATKAVAAPAETPIEISEETAPEADPVAESTPEPANDAPAASDPVPSSEGEDQGAN